MTTPASLTPVLQELRAAKNVAGLEYEHAAARAQQVAEIFRGGQIGVDRAYVAADVAYERWDQARAAVRAAELGDLPARPVEDRDEASR